MLDLFNLEAQTNKRVQRFLLHTSTEENIEPSNARLVINTNNEKVEVHLYSQQKFVKTLTIKAIVEFFGKEYDETKLVSLLNYLKKIAKENHIDFSKSNVVICETKSKLGAHLYNETKYVKRLSTVEILAAIN